VLLIDSSLWFKNTLFGRFIKNTIQEFKNNALTSNGCAKKIRFTNQDTKWGIRKPCFDKNILYPSVLQA